MPVAGRLNGRLNQMDCECGPSAGSVPGTLNANALTRVGDVARATFHLAHHELEPSMRSPRGPRPVAACSCDAARLKAV